MLHTIVEILLFLGLIPGKKEAGESQMHLAMRWIGILIVLIVALFTLFHFFL